MNADQTGRGLKIVTGISVGRGVLSGFETFEVNTGPLSIVVVPELGGKISSLRDTRTGREWLWRNPHLPYARVPHGESYVLKGDTGGWDECFPSVSACDYPSEPWTGTTVQDHGELWSQWADVKVQEYPGDAETVGRVTLRTRWDGVSLPCTVERTIECTADSARLRFEYKVTSNSDAPINFIWSAHPLLAIEPGMELRVPPDTMFHRNFSHPPSERAEGGLVHFPLKIGDYDLTALPDRNSGIAVKLWSEPMNEGWAAVCAREGEFRLSWDAAELPQLGIYLNLGAWGQGDVPYYVMGVEPCMGAQDSLADAVNKYGVFETLTPHATRAWGLRVDLA